MLNAFGVMGNRTCWRVKLELGKNAMAVADPNELPAGTILETDEELRKIREQLMQQAQKSPSPQPQLAEAWSDEQVFRPSMRAPALHLTIYDDGETAGETIRVRDERFTIGRTEGDLRLPNDDLISSRHVSLTRQMVKGKCVWVITDLQSRNGLFIRVAKAPLHHQAEFLIGSGRYRLDLPGSTAGPTQGYSPEDHHRAPVTQAFGDLHSEEQETLTEILRSGIGSRYVLDRELYWIGRDRDCDICRPNDPYLRGKHASLKRSSRGSWVIQHHSTVNGIWLKMPQISLTGGKGCEFQIGEQRFRAKVQ